MNYKSLKNWQKVLIWIILSLIVILFATPRIAKKYIINNSSELIGRTIAIKSIRLNYFSGALRINELTLFEKDTNAPFVSFDKLLVNLDYWPLLRNELLISEISLSNFYSQVEQKGDWFNFSDLINEGDPVESQPDIADTSSESMTLTINNINIANSHVQYTDQLLDHTISLSDIDLHIPGFTWSSGTTDLVLDFDFAKGGGLYSALSFDQVDSTYSINLKLDSLNIDVIEPYIKESLDIFELNGYFSNNINLSGNLQHIMQIHMSGWNKIDALNIFDHEQRNILSFEQFKIDIDTFILENNDIQINEISLSSPFVLVELVDSSNNWLAMMVPEDSTAIDTSNKEKGNKEDDEIERNSKKEFTYSLANLELTNGEVKFIDKTLRYDFESILHEINISSQDLKTAASEVNFNFSAELNNTAKIITNIVLNPNDMEYLEIDFKLQKFALKDIEPYMQHYFGYPVDEGFLNFSSKNELTANSMISSNNLYIRKFELGKPDKKDAEYKLPIRLAIGVLSDKDGIIDLDLPVETQGDETNVKNLGKLVGRTFVNLIVKAATSPIDFLAGLYDVNPEKLKEVKFGMLDNMPEKDELETLDILAKILNDKPKLRAELRYAIDKEKYIDSLAYVLSVNSWIDTQRKQFSFSSSVPDSILSEYLFKKVNKSEIASNTTITDLCIQFIGEENLSTKFDSTTKEHIDFISDYLYTHKALSSNQVDIIEEAADSIPRSSEHGVFHIYFKSKASKEVW